MFDLLTYVGEIGFDVVMLMDDMCEGWYVERVFDDVRSVVDLGVLVMLSVFVEGVLLDGWSVELIEGALCVAVE